MTSPAEIQQIPEGILQTLYPCLGAAVHGWSQTEIGLVYSVAIIYQSGGGKNIEKEIPRSLDRIIKFLRRCFTKLPALSPYKDDALKLLAEIEALAPLRHMLTHGVMSGYAADTNTIHYVKVNVDLPASIHMEERRDTSIAEILDLGHKCIGLASASLKLANSLLQAFVPK